MDVGEFVRFIFGYFGESWGEGDLEALFRFLVRAIRD